jgi:16S rRNA (cytidine1402-2'-O)-methyltransferase
MQDFHYLCGQSLKIFNKMILNNSGQLIVGGMDIGNAEDLGSRIKQCIQSADYILVENKNIFLDKCIRIKIDSKAEIIEYYWQVENGNKIISNMINEIKNGKSVLLISDDGMPAICDPGSELIRAAYETNIKVTVIPGPSILSTLPSIVGLNSTSFTFEQRLPIEKHLREKMLLKFKQDERSFMFLISNRRDENIYFMEILNHIKEVFGKDAFLGVGINLTHKDEMVFVGSIDNIIKQCSSIAIDGRHNISVFVNR